MIDFSKLRFGALVHIEQGNLHLRCLFLGWNEDETRLWLAHESNTPLRRGPILTTVEKERIASFQNVELYESLPELRSWAGGASHNAGNHVSPNSVQNYLKERNAPHMFVTSIELGRCAYCGNGRWHSIHVQTQGEQR